MIQVLIDIGKYISLLFKFILNIITSSVSLILQIPRFIAMITNVVVAFPNILIPFLLGSISIYVILLIIGRNK